MAKDEEKKEQDVEESPQPKKKKPLMKIVVIAVAALVVIAAGTIGALYFTRSTPAKTAAKQPSAAVLWAMEPFIVNLVDNQGDRYLKIIIELEVSDQGCLAELNQIKPRLRDNILDLLTAKTYKELVDIVGKQRLRDEIGIRLNNFLTTGKIVKVYFTEFVIQ